MFGLETISTCSNDQVSINKFVIGMFEARACFLKQKRPEMGPFLKNPFVIRAVVQSMMNRILNIQYSLNPFVIRAVVQLKMMLQVAMLYCLNPFVIRAVVQ